MDDVVNDAVDEVEPPILGETRETIDLDGLDLQREALAHMIRQTRRTVDVVSRDLDRRLFDQSDLLDSLRRIALGNRRASVRLFVMDTGALVRREHRLATLVKRLPSFFEVRGPGSADQRKFNAAFVVADQTGVIYRPRADLYVGEVCFHDPIRAGDLTRQFDKMWEAGVPDMNLRQMRI